MTEFRGARGSNTGDDFHELWATREAIRLLSTDEDLEALAVEGLGAMDEAGAPADTWDGVDCTLYFGGLTAATAKRIVIQQLKYSAASPEAAWTVARLVGAKRRDSSVIARLAKAWKGLVELRPGASVPEVVLISNQPIDPALISAFARAAAGAIAPPRKKPNDAAPEIRLAYAAGLCAGEFQAFSAAIHFEGGAGSRFAVEEKVLRAIADWTDQDIRRVVTDLQQYVRKRMRPEFAGELITRESVMLHLGASEGAALFPCPSEITLTVAPVSRAPVCEAIALLISGAQHLCLHGRGGVGKTTALQEIEAALPAGSVMIKYDCYGGGRYLDPSALRHRPIDAFLQLTNEVAARLKLPLLLSRHQGSDYPRLFVNRLMHAAGALAAQQPGALMVIAIDAADNAVTAAQSRAPADPSFVHDFVLLSSQPENVRFVVTARSGRLEQLRLPSFYQTIELKPFSRPETGENVGRVWSAPESWIDDFHHLSGGVPRVQSYAFQVDGEHPSAALDRLRPDGKSLDEVFRQQFAAALSKSGNPAEVARLCAGLVALPRPVPLTDLAAVLKSTEAQLTDVCADLAPGIRLHNGLASFADEDFEQFVRTEGFTHLGEVQQEAGAWLLSRAAQDRYAALNVAAALVAAGRGAELLDLVEREPAPMAVADPVLRREAQVQRLRLAIKVCREAGDVSRALRFVLIGGEGIKTEVALRELLVSNPDMAACFAQETAGRLILSDPDEIENHGPLLFQKLGVDADRGDAISVREGWRMLHAWMQVRKERYLEAAETHHPRAWEISIADISSEVEAALKLEGPAVALQRLESWTPRTIALKVGLSLPLRLIAEGRVADIEAFITAHELGPIGKLFLLLPLALAGRSVDVDQLAPGLKELSRRKLSLKRYFDGSYHTGPSTHGLLLDAVLTTCEILTSKGAATALVDSLLDRFLAPELRRIDRRHPFEAAKLDILFRAHALREVRAGRTPTATGVFERRPDLSDRDKRTDASRWAEEHDRSLMELTSAIFGLYAAVADALVNRRTDAELSESLRRAVARLKSEEWRISRRHGSVAVRRHTAKSLLTLLAAGYDAQALKKFASDVHGGWRIGNNVPDEEVVARLSLRGELHEALLDDLVAGAAETRAMRIGADEKSKTLVNYARLLKPISPLDANEVFNQAVEVASELDEEVMAQISVLEKLIARAAGTFPDVRRTARQLSDVVADAAIRLSGHDHFPWNDSISALARLDPPLALANAARWDDESVATLHETLPPLLKTALRQGSLNPAQGAAITMFLDGDHRVLTEILEQSASARNPNLPRLVEEAAYDVLIRYRQSRNDVVTRIIEQHRVDDSWAGALARQERFLSLLAPEPPARPRNEIERTTKARNPLEIHVWSRDALLDSANLGSAIEALEEQARAEQSYLPISEILRSARDAVILRDRVAYLSALAGLDDVTQMDGAAKALLEAIEAWWDSPAIKNWCRATLPRVIVARLPELSFFVEEGKDDLTVALERTGLAEHERRELVLQGIERHVDGMSADLIFALAGLVGGRLAAPDAAELADWYAERLASRIPPEERDQTVPDAELPQSMDEAVARFVFAYMGDFDLRNRWRAAHAVRRLARTRDATTVNAFIAQYGRREERAFRAADLPFYWLGARLWFVVAWDRVAGECPDMAEHAGPALLQIALDDTFPHLLVRSFARDSCEKLAAAGRLSVSTDDRLRLQRVNESPLPRSPKEKATSRHFAERDEGRRFRFDSMDTLPYWYTPLIEGFAAVNGERFLQEVERWIVDVWGYSGDIRDFEKERRRDRFDGRDWALSSNRHGSMPTLERLNTHLEWHAMWCAAGELLKTDPLAVHDDEWDIWDDLKTRIKEAKLAEPPLWSTDLLVPVPLIPRNWQIDSRPVDEWALAVREADYWIEMFPEDAPEYVVVDGHCQRRSGDRTETISIASALVEPATGGSLVRALQAMEEAWDYKLPEEGENFEIDEEPYRLLGWLNNPSRDSGIDEKDPFRGYASIIAACPGRRATEACELTRDHHNWRPRWFSKTGKLPMFVYESWGEEERDDERYISTLAVAGRRLLAHKEQLQDFLCGQGLDLITEVQVRRSGNRRYAGAEEKEPPEGRFDRLYRFQGGGALEVAEGCVGAWAGDRPGT